MACRGAGVRVSLAPFLKKVSPLLSSERSTRAAFLVRNGLFIFCAPNAIRRRHLHAHHLIIYYDFQAPDGNFMLDVATQLGFQER